MIEGGEEALTCEDELADGSAETRQESVERLSRTSE